MRTQVKTLTKVEDLDLNYIDLDHVIPSIEEIIEMQKLLLEVNPSDMILVERMRNIRVLLCSLHFRNLGFQ